MRRQRQKRESFQGVHVFSFSGCHNGCVERKMNRGISDVDGKMGFTCVLQETFLSSAKTSYAIKINYKTLSEYLPSPAKLFMSRARLVTGDKTVAGPGEKRFLQCVFFVLSSGRESEDNPGIPSGLFFKTVFTGLVQPKALTDSICSCSIYTNPKKKTS